MINSQWLELTMSRINFHGSSTVCKDIRCPNTSYKYLICLNIRAKKALLTLFECTSLYWPSLLSYSNRKLSFVLYIIIQKFVLFGSDVTFNKISDIQ